MKLGELLQNNTLTIQTKEISYTKMRVSVSSGYYGLNYRFLDMSGNLLFELQEHEMKYFVNRLKKLLELSKIEIK